MIDRSGLSSFKATVPPVGFTQLLWCCRFVTKFDHSQSNVTCEAPLCVSQAVPRLRSRTQTAPCPHKRQQHSTLLQHRPQLHRSQSWISPIRLCLWMKYAGSQHTLQTAPRSPHCLSPKQGLGMRECLCSQQHSMLALR